MKNTVPPVARALALVSLALFAVTARPDDPKPSSTEIRHAEDEPKSGHTLRGSPVIRRGPKDFPAESRDIFWQMDAVASGDNGALEPLNFDKDSDGMISDKERDAIRGRNTWLLWAAGNEAFWGWLQEDGYGLVDFLILLDSRERGTRFDSAGMINQPGMAANHDATKKILGLYLDQPAMASPPLPDWLQRYQPQSVLQGSSGAYGKASPIGYTHPLRDRVDYPANRPPRKELFPTEGGTVPMWNPDGTVALDDKGAEKTRTLEEFVQEIRKDLPKDGVDYDIYGYPSGVVGLRLFLNPDFFSNTPAADQARRYWHERVERTEDRYYKEPALNGDPKLVRPFRVGMSCAFCHVGPHPLSPPADRNEPQWHNLSSFIGAQYWKPRSAFGNLLTQDSFLYHFLHSQKPGTIDTSLVSTDHINNANTINGVFELNARIGRALANPTETQSAENKLLRSIEDPAGNSDERHTPRVLLDGADSIGAYGALARVYLNIGTFWEEWKLRHNAVVGFRPQQPFELQVCAENSVYWQVNRDQRVQYLADFFLFKRDGAATPRDNGSPATYHAQNATGSMKLRFAKTADGAANDPAAKNSYSDTQRKAGRLLWINQCAICHSSKQPEGFALEFLNTWKTAAVPQENEPAKYTLPLQFSDWREFRKHAAFEDYIKRLNTLIAKEYTKQTRDAAAPANLEGDPWDDDHPFWRENYLSSDIRVPLSLVGTNPGRALATNGIAGQMWDNFTSITYKKLPASGELQYYDLVKGNKASFEPKADGRGYYRPATHAALWATAPFLHNNTVGFYNDDPSVAGRLTAFEDAIRRMLSPDLRSATKLLHRAGAAEPAAFVTHPGDLRPSAAAHGDSGWTPTAFNQDPGYIYRLPLDTHVRFAAGFIRPLVEGIVGPVLTSILTVWIWVVLFLLFTFFAFRAQARHAGIVLLLLAILAALVIAYSGMSGMTGTTAGLVLTAISNLLELSAHTWWLATIVLTALGVAFFFVRADNVAFGKWVIVLLGAGAAILAWRLLDSWLAGGAAFILALLLSWSWRWEPAKFARLMFTGFTIVTVVAGWSANRFVNGKPIVSVPGANLTIGPLPIDVGPIPRGTPVNLMMNMDPESEHLPRALAATFAAFAKIKKQGLTGEAAWTVLSDVAGPDLLKASKCPDFVLDKGHGFGADLTPEEKESLIAFLLTL